MNTIARCLATLSLALAMAAAAGSAQADDFDVTFDKVFTPNNIGPGSVSTLTFTIQNTSEIEGVEELAFTDTLPANVTIADGSGSTTCANATLSAPSGTSTITFSDGQLGTASSCTVTVNVTSSTPGTHMNTSGDLTYTHFVGGIEEPGNAGSASDDLTVDSGLPAFSKSFAPDPIGLNGTSTLTFTIDNSINDSNVNSLDFTDTLPTGLQVASPANASTTCGDPLIPAVLTATPGSSTIILDSDGIEGFPAVASGATCTVTVDIKGTSAGTHTNVAELQVTIGFTTSSAGFASDALTVNGSPSSLLITKEFTDDPVGPGGTVTLDFTISNGNRDFPATGIAFTDNLAAFAPPLSTGAVYTSLLSNDCGGSVDGVGTTLIDFSGGSLPVEGSCSIRTSLTIPNDATGDAYTNTTSDVTGMINGVEVTGNTASNQLTVVDALPPLFSKSFTNDPVPAGTEATLVYTIQNPNASAGFTDIEFSELFRFVFNATLASSSNTCGATINDTVVPVILSFNHLRVDVSGGSLSAGAACTVTLNINVPASTPDDSYLTESDELTADSGGTPVSGGTAIDTLFVSATSGENSAMKFSKEFVDDPVNAGASTTLRFTIENTGDTDVTGVTFSDDLGSGGMDEMLTGAAASGLPLIGVCGDGTLSGTSGDTFITLTGATLSPGEVCVFDVTVDIPGGAASGDYPNETSALSGTAQTDPTAPVSTGAAEDTLTVYGTDNAPVILTKEFTDDPVLPGGTVTLEFTITNPNSVGGATGIFFTDDIGTAGGTLLGLTSNSGTLNNVCGTGSQIAGTTLLTFTGGSLAAAGMPGDSCTFSVELTVPPGVDDDSYQNTTSAPTSNFAPGLPAIDSLVIDSAVLSFTKEFTDDPVKPGDDATLLFTITNPLGVDVTDLAFTDDLNAMLSGASFDSMAITNTCNGSSPTGGLFDYSLGSISAGASCTITIPVTIPPNALPGDYDNETSTLTGMVGAAAVSAAPARDTLEVEPQFPPTFMKLFDDASPVLSGDSVQLTFTISNTDLDNPLDSLAFTDDIATMMLPGATFSGAPPNPCDGTLTVSGDTLLSFSGGTAPAGGDCSFDVTVNVPDAAPAGDFVNTTSNLNSNGLKQADPASDTLTVTPSADLAISITDSADPVVPGTAMTYTVDVDNLGPQDAANVVVTVTLPAEVTLVSTAGCAEDPNGVPTCSLDTIFSGGSASFTIDVNVNPDATSAFDTDVSVASVTLDPNAANDADTESTDVAPQADISVTKDDGVTEVSAGGTVTYTIEVTNAGPSDDPMVSVTDAFPAKLTACPFTSVAAGGATGNTDGAGDIGDTLSMPVGSSVTYTATCTVDVAASGNLVNTAEVEGSFEGSFDPVPGNDSATDTDTINPAILDFSKAFAPDTISQGEETVLTFTIDNTGNAIEAAMLTFDDDLAPFGIVVADAPMIGNGCLGDFTALAGTSTLDLADGMVAAGKFCEISVTLRAFDAGIHDNVTSALTSTLPEALPATDTLTVNQAGAPLFSKAFAPDTIDQGEETVLTFTIDNTGNAIEAAMLTFDDDLAPFGIVVADAPMIGNGCLGDFTALAGTSTLDLADGMVAAGKFCEISVTLRAFDAGIHDNVTSALTSTLPEALPATDTLTVNAASAPLFSKAFLPDTIYQGEETVLTFTIDNTGNAIEAAMLTFDDDLAPFGIVVADAPMIGNGCLGDFTALAGTSTLDLADGMVAAGKFCEISVTLRALDAGMHDNVTSALTSTLPEALPATDTLTVNQAGAPLFSKAFAPDTIDQGEETVLTFTIDNTGNAIEAAMLTFDDDLAPFGIVVADAPMIGNGCLGDFTALAGTSTLDLADGMVAAGKFCEISVTLRAFDAGIHDNVTSALTSTLPEALPATDTLTVNQAGAPLFSKAFAPDTIDQGEETVLTFTIDNTGNAIEAAMLTFDDDLAPFGIVVADAPMIGNGCLGDFTALAGTSTLDLADGMVAAGKFCEISVTLRAFDAGMHDNVTSALTSTLPEALPATDTLTVNQAGAPLFSKAFAPDTIDQGEETVLTFTIDNTGNAIEAAMLTFDDDLAPFGIVVADAPMIGNGCLGDFTALAGTSTLDLADGMVAAGKFCEISVTLRALDAGIHDNVTSPLTSTLPEAPAAMATLTVTAAEAPQFSKAFAPDTIDQGTVTVLTFTIDNSANAIEASMLSFDDPLPPGVLVAASPNSSNTCGGAFTAASGADTVDLADGTVAAGAVCELSVRVRAFEFGDRLNTTSLLGSSLGDAPAATATLTVNALPPAFSKTFTPDTIAVTGISRLVFLIDNSAASIPATGLDFTDVLPDDLVIAAVPKASSGCGGGTITAPAGGGTFAYSGGTVNALDRCIVGVDVTSDVAGSYPNTSGDLTSSLGNSGTASATLTVEEAQVGTITILQFTDFDGIFTFTSDEPDLNFLVPTEDGFGSVGPITLPAGSYSVTQTRPTGVGNLEIFCSDDDSTGVRNTGVLTLNIDALEAVTCSFVSIKTDQITIDIINRFLALRIKLILANQPELGRRLERLARGFDSSSPVTFSNGDLGAMTPFTFNPLSLGSGQYRFSTSLAQVERAAASIALAHGDIAARRFVENRRFDAWVEMSYQKFDDNAANDGHFGIAFAGVDYLLTDDLLVGAVLQVDDMKDSDDASNSTVSGLGWMFGPYVTARVAPNLYFDARLAYGKSTNEISPFNTYTDTFTGERWLVSAGLVGEFKRGPWMIRPAANLSYFEETQAAYVDSLGAAIPSQTVALGQIQIGPTISGRFETANGVIYQPSLTLDGIYNFGETRGVTVTNPNAPETEGFRARVKAGVVFTNEMGTRIGISGIYDGIGQSDFESLGLSFELNIPLYKAKAR